jgi:putative ABC transport system ATP-binding protein
MNGSMNMNKETIEMAEQATTDATTVLGAATDTAAAPVTDAAPVTPAAEPVPMFRLAGVDKVYTQKNRTVHALHRVDLTIPAGQLVAIQGSTGGGKSTLLQMLGALDRPTTGTVTLAGQEISTLGDRDLARIRARDIGFVFQHYNLIPTLTAQENVEMGLAPLDVTAEERASRAAAALASVGLEDRASHLPGELSGGQQQRVAIARALAKRPKVLLADEPTGNLDEATRDDIMGLLEGLWQAGLTIIMVTHDSAVARRAERRLRINAGRVTEAA